MVAKKRTTKKSTRKSTSKRRSSRSKSRKSKREGSTTRLKRKGGKMQKAKIVKGIQFIKKPAKVSGIPKYSKSGLKNYKLDKKVRLKNGTFAKVVLAPQYR
jgi:hypothetical protein